MAATPAPSSPPRSCDGGDLDPDDDIELVVTRAHSASGDHTPCAVSIRIEALDYPDRVRTEEERANRIRDGVKELLATPGLKVGVWLKLTHAVWTSA